MLKANKVVYYTYKCFSIKKKQKGLVQRKNEEGKLGLDNRNVGNNDLWRRGVRRLIT